MKFPQLYRGEFGFAAWFSGRFDDLPQYPRTGQTNAIVLGLTSEQIGNVLIKLTEAESTILRIKDMPPSVVFHPLLIITALLSVFSEEDGATVNKCIHQLQVLQQKINTKDASRLGDVSIELNQLSSSLRVIQMGNTYVQSLVSTLLSTSFTVPKGDALPEHPKLAILIQNLTVAESQKNPPQHANEYLSNEKQPWLPLIGQFKYIQTELEQLKYQRQERTFDMECLQKQIDINLNVVSEHPLTKLHHHQFHPSR